MAYKYLNINVEYTCTHELINLKKMLNLVGISLKFLQENWVYSSWIVAGMCLEKRIPTRISEYFLFFFKGVLREFINYALRFLIFYVRLFI